MWSTLGALVHVIDGASGVNVADTMVCVGAGGDVNVRKNCSAVVHCLNAHSGEHLWSAPTGLQIQSRPAVGRRNLYVGDYDACMYAFELRTGRRQWRSCTNDTIEGSAVVAATSAAGEETVIVTSWDGYLYGFDGANGDVRWKLRLAPPSRGLGSSPVLSANGHKVYVGGIDGLWAVETQSGAVVWHFATGHPIGSTPTLSRDEGKIFVGGEDGYLYAFSI